jgi:CpeT/CpcT family (DUF1001)
LPLKNILAVLLAALIAACATPAPEAQKSPPPAKVDLPAIAHAERDLGLLAYLLQGSWHTVWERDEGENMVMHLVRLWPDRKDGVWFYWEIVSARDQGKVVRQRIVHYIREVDRLYAENYRVPGGPLALGEWRKEQPFAQLDPGTLVVFPGCREELMKQFDVAFAVGTAGKECRGDFAADLHQHFEYALSPAYMRLRYSLEDGSDHQVSGLEDPLQFRKHSEKLQ